MPRRIFLHVGTPRSGASTVIAGCAAERERLAAAGLTFPATPAGVDPDHAAAAADLLARQSAREPGRDAWAALVAEVRRAPGDVLISAPELASAGAEQIAAVMADLDGGEVHLLLTVRDPARQIVAGWQYGLEQGRVRSFRRFLLDLRRFRRIRATSWFWRSYSVPDVLTRWGNGLPPDRIHVITVPPAAADPGVLGARFGRVLGLGEETLPVLAVTGEANLSAGEATMLRLLNRRLRGRGVPDQAYRDLVAGVALAEVRGRRTRQWTPIEVPPGRWRFLDQVSREWIDWLEGAGVDVVGDLAELRPEPPGPDRSFVHPDRPPAEEVAEAAVAALAGVVAEVASPSPSAVRRLARRLRWGEERAEG